MRFFGKVGYGVSGETVEGVWKDAITERSYYGDVKRNTRRLVQGTDANSDLKTTNVISILADPYALEHFHAIKYVEWAGALWNVDDVEAESPRLTLRLGGVYTGPSSSSGPTGTDSGR